MLNAFRVKKIKTTSNAVKEHSVAYLFVGNERMLEGDVISLLGCSGCYIIGCREILFGAKGNKYSFRRKDNMPITSIDLDKFTQGTTITIKGNINNGE